MGKYRYWMTISLFMEKIQMIVIKSHNIYQDYDKKFDDIDKIVEMEKRKFYILFWHINKKLL